MVPYYSRERLPPPINEHFSSALNPLVVKLRRQLNACVLLQRHRQSPGGLKRWRTSNCLKQGQASAEIQLDPLKGRPDTSSQPRKNRDKRMVSRRRRLRSRVNLLVSDYRPFLFFYIKFPRQEAEEAVSFARLVVVPVEIFRPKRSFCVFRQREVFEGENNRRDKEEVEEIVL